MPQSTAIVLSVGTLSRPQRRRATRLVALAHACVRWLDYGWRTLASAKFMRIAAAALAFAATIAGVNAGGAVSPVGASFRVNEGTAWVQRNSACAMDADGDFVVVWESYASAQREIFGRRYNAAGAAQGGDFLVGDFYFGWPAAPDVAMDAAGNFTVAWAQADGSGNGIWAQRFDAAGNRLGHNFLVNEQRSLEQYAPAIAVEPGGDFVIAWDSQLAEASSYSGSLGVGIAARRFDADGSPKGGEFVVNSSYLNNQTEPDVAVDGDGDFVIAWMSAYHDGDYWGIVAQRFDNAGDKVDPEFQVNQSYAGNQQYARVAMDGDGDFVIAWQSYYRSSSYNPVASASYSVSHSSVFVRRYDATGPAGDEQLVARGDAFIDNDRNTRPAVAVDADGDFAVAWERYTPTAHTIRVQAYKPDGAVEGSALAVSSVGYDQYAPDIAMMRGGNFVIVRHGSGPGDFDGIFARQYSVADDNAPPVVAGVHIADNSSHVLEDERLASRPDALTVVFSQAMDSSIESPGMWLLERDGEDVSDLIVDVSFAFNTGANRFEATLTFTQPLSDGAYALTLREFAFSPQNLLLDGDADGQEGGDFTRRFVVAAPVALGGDVRANFSSDASREHSSVAMDAEGNFVVVWAETRYYSGSYFSNAEIHLRRYNANGTVAGPDTNLTQTNGNFASVWEAHPDVAMDTDGNFVVAWVQYTDYGPFGDATVMAQRFDASGGALGGPFALPATGAPQRHCAVAMSDDSDFVVVFASDFAYASGGDDILAVRYRDGAAGPILRVAAEPLSDFGNPDVAMDVHGAFVAAWEQPSVGIFARSFDAFDNDFGIVSVQASVTFQNTRPAVAMDNDGSFVVAWEGYTYSSVYAYIDEIIARRFRVDGVALGGEIRVSNSSAAANPRLPAIAMDSDGDFAITWHAQGDYAGATYGIAGRVFNFAATPQAGQFQVNATLSGNQWMPAIAMDSDGDFVVAWQGAVDFSSATDAGAIALRRFGANEPPIVWGISAISVDEDDPDVLVDFDANGAFSDSTDGDNLAYTVENNSAPGLITATFSGAVLTISLAPDAEGDAMLTIRATDSGGKWAEALLQVTITGVNDAPVITPGAPQLTDVLEDATNPPGNTVAEIVGATISDVDAGALQGIAIIAAPANIGSEGRWQYFTAEGGVWTNFPALSAASALLLRPADKVRFIPVAGFVGTRTLTYHGWDQTTGAVGPGGDLAGGTGGTTAYSAATDTATVAINSINDAPVLDSLGSPALSDVDEDDAAPLGDAVLNFIGASITDPDPGALKGIAVIGVDSANGTWQYSLDSGVNWVDLSSASNNAAVLLRDVDMVRFIPNAEFNGAADISYRAWDRTTGNPGDSVSLSGGGTTGGSTAFSAETESATVTVTPVNDAPILDTTGTPRLGTISNNFTPAGTPVTTLIGASITDLDNDALEGVAITDLTGAGGGVWQYSIDDGATFQNFPAVSESMALLLRDTDLIRFAPNTSFVGAATVTFRAWDQSSGTAGTTADLTAVGAVGGITPYSQALETASVDVTAAGEDDKGNNCAATGGSGGVGLLALLLAVLAALRAAVVNRRTN
ncbi:MAG: hypothetical protein IT462_06165 [Planctomycetes bacterium]|nr:hypothetical protein [Planctomycetota bacterium]